MRRTAILFALLAAACRPEEPRAPDSPAVPGGTAIVGVASEATTLLPPLAAAALDFELGGNLFLPLNFATWEEGGLRYVAPHPLALARSWTIGAHGSSVTYLIDTERRWSDGTPVRAADVVFTYELLSDTILALPLSSTAEQLDSVVAVNDSTVTFHFERPYPAMLFDTGVGIIPEHVYGGVSPESMRGMPEAAAADDGLIVSGPYRLAEWHPSDRIVLERNEASVHPPRLDRIVIRVLPDEIAREAELRSGRLDLAQINSFAAAQRLARDSAIRVLRIEQRGYDYIAWNPAGHPAFDDVRVREALSLALDRPTMIAALDMRGYAEPAAGPYGSLFSHLAASRSAGSAYDPNRSRALLERAGWTDTDGDGTREKDGVRLVFTLATTAGNERREAAAQVIQSQLADVGAHVEVRLEEFRSLLGRAMARDYEAVLLGWQVGLDPDISIFWRSPDSPFNLVGFDDAGVSAMIDSARSRATAEEAAPYWRDAADRISAEHPYAWLWYFDLPLAVGPRLRDVSADVTGFGSAMWQWWIPAELQHEAR